MHTGAAEKQNKYFAEAKDVVIEAIKQANSELWQMISDPGQQVDLVFVSTIPVTENATYGETRVRAFYGDRRETSLADALDRRDDLKQETITIVIDVVPPVLRWWDRSAGQTAATIAHEYAIHAERFVEMIRIIRTKGNMTQDGFQELIARVDKHGDFSADVHHHSIAAQDKPDSFMLGYKDLVDRMAALFSKNGQEKEAKNLRAAFATDIEEHQTQEKVAALVSWASGLLGRR